jgi:two-component system, LytTR family, response regulator
LNIETLNNQTINCIIVDDERSAINVLKRHVESHGLLNLAHATNNPKEALRIITEQPIHIAFLDIKMPGITGIELAAAIKGKCKIIFTTAYSQFVSDALDMDADVVDYLLKPIPLPRFIRAVDRAISGLNLPQPTGPSPAAMPDSLEHDYIFVKTEQKGTRIRVMLAHIEYVQAMRKQVVIYHAGQITTAQHSISEIEEKLPPKYFMRVHKSFIVALHKITGVEGSRLLLQDTSAPISIGEVYKPQFMELMKHKLMR